VSDREYENFSKFSLNAANPTFADLKQASARLLGWRTGG